MKSVIVLLMVLMLPVDGAPHPKKAPTPRPARATPTPTPAPTPVVLPRGVEKFTVATNSQEAWTFYLRVPARYSKRSANRVLFLCPDNKISALEALTKSASNTAADERGWFVLASNALQDAEGQTAPVELPAEAVFQAIESAQAKYPLSGEALTLQGIGSGGLFVQRMASEYPEKIQAVGLGIVERFVPVGAWASKMGWVVTTIDGDPASAPASSEFVSQLRAQGIKPVVRSFSEMARPIRDQVDSGEIGTLEAEFFRSQEDRSQGADFVGDLRNLRYFKEDSPEAMAIPEESRVFLGTDRLARYWGARIEKFLVPTASPLNAEVPFYVRVPANYSPTTRARVFLRCPVFNGIGVRYVSGNSAYQDAADERGWFMIAPTFKQDKADTKDRSKSYYYPETFSGQAILDGLDLVATKYPIVTDGLLLQGLSGGAQFVHRFALWAPDRVTAVAVNSSSWFDAPGPSSARVAWLVTIGESDRAFNNSLTFFEQLRYHQALPIFRSYVGMVHEGNSKVDELNLPFLKFYDDVTRPKLLGQKVRFNPGPVIPPKAMPLVGDTKDWSVSKNETKAIMRIGEENVVYLPSAEIATLWAGKGDDAGPK